MMKYPRLVIIRGKPTSGKSTAFQTLKNDSRLKHFIFIDFPAIKNTFDYLPDNHRKKIGKEILFSTLRYLLPLKKDVFLEEMSRGTISNNLAKEIRKYRYKIIVFQFEVSLETAYKRNVQRAKDNWHPLMSKTWVEESHKLHESKFDKQAIVIDTDKLSKKQVIEFLVKKLR